MSKNSADRSLVQKSDSGRIAAAGGAALQQGGLEPAAVLVGAFQVGIGRPPAVGSVLQGEGVGRPGIEPDVEDVLDLLVAGRIVVAEEVAVGAGEPGVGAFFG